MPNQNLKSHNSQQYDLVKDLFMPSLLQISLYFLTSIVLLTVLNAIRFWEYLNKDLAGRNQALELFGSGADGGSLLGSGSYGRIGQMVIWGLVGVFIYIVVWFLKNIIVNLRNDIVADEYVHPHSYKRSKYWQSVLSRKALFVLISLVLIVYIYLLFQLLPVILDYFYRMVVDFNTQNALYGLAAVASTTLLLHIFISLCRLTISAWRFIYTDL